MQIAIAIRAPTVTCAQGGREKERERGREGEAERGRERGMLDLFEVEAAVVEGLVVVVLVHLVPPPPNQYHSLAHLVPHRPRISTTRLHTLYHNPPAHSTIHWYTLSRTTPNLRNTHFVPQAWAHTTEAHSIDQYRRVVCRAVAYELTIGAYLVRIGA